MKRNKTYAISNPHVQNNNPLYSNAHPQIELVLNKYTTVNEASEQINVDNIIVYEFLKLQLIDPIIHNTEAIDICGIVIKVREKKTTRTARGATKYVREITIMDSESRSVVVSLWEDMATNDGNDLQLLANEYPIISIGHVTAKKYLGELQLQTTMASIIQINSGHEEVEHLRSCNEEKDKRSKGNHSP
ncbi:hypothetical protein ACP275_03G019300 [Erythranthe tilingii]